MINSSGPSDLAKAADGADYVLHVSTPFLGAGFHPLKWGQYRFVGGMKLLVVDASTRKVVASGDYMVNDFKKYTDYDGVLADDAAFVRRELAALKKAATDHFMANILGISTP